MPPRFAYWTILIDNAPTAFRARDAQELLPTLTQLKRTNSNVVMRWFSGGKLWDSPEAAREARRRPAPPREKRSADWRPGGAHKDPRDRFKGKPRRDKFRGAQSFKAAAAGAPGAGRKPWHGKQGRPHGQRPWRPKPPWGGKQGASAPPKLARESMRAKPGDKPGGRPRGDKRWESKATGGSGESGGSRGSGRSGARPWSAKPPGGGGREWQNRPNDDRHRKRRDDEPES